jgi:hypothetical protein
MKKPEPFVSSRQLSTVLSAVILLLSPRVIHAQGSNDVWSGGGDGVSWNQAANWTPSTGNAPPISGDTLEFGNTGQGTLNNNLAFQLAAYGISFDAGSTYTLNGNSVLLSGYTNGAGILNNAGSAQTFGLPLALDWGLYTFTTTGGGSIALNGGLTLNTGGVAFFDANNTSTTLVNDGSGLISGLGGSGLIYNSGTGAFTGLAAMSGTSIATYSFTGPNTFSGGGTIGAASAGSAANLELTDTAAANYTLVGGSGITYANTIFLGGTFTGTGPASPIVLASGAGAQTLDLGAVSGIGGIYVPNANTNRALTIGTGSSTILTAGPETGGATSGTLVLAVNGNSSANQVQVNASIANNGSGGAVSVVKIGTGSMFFANLTSEANMTYSGGTYVLQGLLQSSHAGGTFGTGPVYVAGGATAYLANSAATFANAFYLTPGQGAIASGVNLEPGVNAGALLLAAGDTLSGKITLAGPAVSYSTPTAQNPGCRISGSTTGITASLTGQLTGPGTLDMNGNHTWTLVLNNPVTSGAGTNNFQGGIILDPLTGHAINEDLKMGTNNQMAGGNLTLVAPNSSTTTYSRFDLNGTTQIMGALIGTGGLPQTNQLGNFATSTPATLIMGANNQSGLFAGTTSDNAASPINLIKIGTGTQTFQTLNSSTFNLHGTITISNGTFALNNGVTMPNVPLITVAVNGTFDITTNGAFTVGASQTLNCVGTVNSTANNLNISGVIEATNGSGPGTLANTGNLYLNSGGTYLWAINNGTGSAGASSGWSYINVGGTLNINSSSGTPFNINISSLGSAAANFNPSASGSWIIASAAGGISGFTSPSQFNISTVNFVNAPTSASQWSIGVSGNNLVLTYTPFQALTVPLPTNAVTVVQNQNTVFTVTANSMGTSPSFSWTQDGNPLVNGGTSAGGGNVTIATSNGGYTSTLTIAHVDQSSAPNDTSAIGVSVTETFGGPQSGSSSEQLNVIDAPTTATLTPGSQPSAPSYQGSGVLLTAQGFGQNNSPVFYQWYLNGTAITGATNSTYMVELSATNYTGTYSAQVYNAAGGVMTSTTYTPTANPPLSVVPNQLIFEPFNYPGPNNVPGFAPARGGPVGNGLSWTALGAVNNYNQQTGVPVGWLETGVNIDFRTRTPDDLVDPASTVPAFAGPSRPLTGPLDEYPVPGLASGFTWQGPNSVVNTNGGIPGDWGWGYNPDTGDTNMYINYGVVGSDPVAYVTTDHNGNQVNLPLGETITNGTLYCSMVIDCSGLNPAGGAADYFCGFGNGATNGTTIWGGLYLTNLAGSAPTPYEIGIFKGNLTPGAANPSLNGGWDANQCSNFQIYFVVMRLNINAAGGSTCDLWIDPSSSSYYASEGSVPPPDVQGVGGTATDVPGGVSFFYIKATTYPVSRDLTDLRIGTTWASVTPPSAPTLSVNSAVLTPCSAAAPVVFTAQNAGNQVASNYTWTFNGGGGPVALHSGAQPNPVAPGDGAVMTVSGPSNQVLTVTGATGQEIGAYTVSGFNISPAPSDNGGPNQFVGIGTEAVTNYGSATATLSFMEPTLAIAYVSGGSPSLVLSWPTNTPSCYTLQQATSLAPKPVSWSAVSAPVVVSGPNNTVTITPVPTVPTYYELTATP